MANSVQVKLKKDGRVRAPKLGDPHLKAIGDGMVAEQKDRWTRAVNADGQPAKKLSVRYAIIKQRLLHKRPTRDMKLTGATIENFKLRRANENRIRAENTTRLERAKARRAQTYDQMVGFSMADVTRVVMDTQAQYQSYVEHAWIPVGQGAGGTGQWVAKPGASSYSKGNAANQVWVGSGRRVRRPSAMRR